MNQGGGRMTREEAAEFTRKLLARAEINALPGNPKRINNIPVFYFEAVLSALRGPQPDPDTKRCLEWVETTERLPAKEDAGIDGMVAFCYRDEWDCFNRLEKWDEIKPQKHTYWHKMLKAPVVEE